MIVYIFDKLTRTIINKFENPLTFNDDSIIFKDSVFMLGENNDFVISSNIYNFGDTVPYEETNKEIKTIEAISIERITNVEDAINMLMML